MSGTLELLCLLEQARAENADAFAYVSVDEDGEIVDCVGPFPQAEQALAAAARFESQWKGYAQPGEGEFTFIVVPIWSPEHAGA